jgi:hypothetical protein
MWYPNRAQWRVIWGMAIIVTLFAVVAATNGEPFLLFIMFLVDGGLLIWKLQNRSEK